MSPAGPESASSEGKLELQRMVREAIPAAARAEGVQTEINPTQLSEARTLLHERGLSAEDILADLRAMMVNLCSGLHERLERGSPELASCATRGMNLACLHPYVKAFGVENAGSRLRNYLEVAKEIETQVGIHLEPKPPPTSYSTNNPTDDDLLDFTPRPRTLLEKNDEAWGRLADVDRIAVEAHRRQVLPMARAHQAVVPHQYAAVQPLLEIRDTLISFFEKIAAKQRKPDGEPQAVIRRRVRPAGASPPQA